LSVSGNAVCCLIKQCSSCFVPAQLLDFCLSLHGAEGTCWVPRQVGGQSRLGAQLCYMMVGTQLQLLL
jgi:hypothetical protein